MKRVWVVLLLLAGCAGPPQIIDRQDFLAEATRSYPGEAPESIITAAQVILRQSDPAFDFRNTLTGFVGIRPYLIYAVLAAERGQEKWELSTERTENDTRVALTVSEAGMATGGYVTTKFERQLSNVPLYRLFWDRMDYMLGRRPDWISCAQANAALPRNMGIAALSGLCGPTSQGRDAPAPEPLPPIVAKKR